MNDHQKFLLSMLKDFDRVCHSCGIRYQLFSGTALGAARHQGFIPWDDDIDVILLREEYDRFFETAAKLLDPELYYVQKEYSDHWPMQFSKLRRNGTACMEKYHPKDSKMHQGIYIDIFPCDNLAENQLTRRMQFLASKVVIAKALYARGYETDSAAKKIILQLCRLLPQKPFWAFTLRKKDKTSAMVHSFFGCGSKYKHNVFPRAWFQESAQLPFEDAVFPVSAQYEALLTALYGDWKKLPEPAQRKQKEHAAIVDTGHSYTEYLEQQRTMRFDSYTRSIR